MGLMEIYQTFRYYKQFMFQNTFQNGHFFELFDPKSKDPSIVSLPRQNQAPLQTYQPSPS